MIKMELADIYDLYRLREIKWGYSDFTKELSSDGFFGYGVIDVDAGGIGYDVIDEDNEIYFGYYRCDSSVALRPTMSYSYVKDFVENKNDLGNGILEVTFGEYPNSKIDEIVNSEELVKTGRHFTIKENNELVKLDEYVDTLGNKMVSLNGNYYKVEELKWLVDTYKDIMITKDAINGGFAYEAKLSEFEEAEANWFDEHCPRKLSQRQIMIANKGRNDNTLANNFMGNIMINEIVDEVMLQKISQRDIEKARIEKEEKARLEEIKKERRRLQRERTRAQRERRNLLRYLFPVDAMSSTFSIPFSSEEEEQLKQVIAEELPNVKNYVDDKEKLIELLIYVYKCKDGKERLLPYPEIRYDACRAYLENFDLDYLNVSLMVAIGNNKTMASHMEYLINNDVLVYRLK